MKEPYLDYGVVENSGEWSGLASADARKRMAAFAKSKGFGNESITFRIKDWGISRQRYWGTPIPMILLPRLADRAGGGERSAGAAAAGREDYGQGPVAVGGCAGVYECGVPEVWRAGAAQSDTMDTFVDSSWYFYRYCDAKNDKAPFDLATIAHWFPIDQYIGGVEHAILHLIYSRFWTR